MGMKRSCDTDFPSLKLSEKKQKHNTQHVNLVKIGQNYRIGAVEDWGRGSPLAHVTRRVR